MSLDLAVQELRDSVKGIVDSSSRRLAEYSSDASNYRVLPTVVVMPKDEEDVLTAIRIARRHGQQAEEEGPPVLGTRWGPEWS
jgi:FAD/FMN-containing dehydrogenase